LLGFGSSHAGANTAEVSINTSLADLGSVYDSGGILLQAGYTLATSNPTSLLFCESGGTLSQWVNGASVSSTVTGLGTGVIGHNPSNLYLGSLAGGGTSWAGAYLTKALVCSSGNGAACF
jgi:hypothetical protein